MPEPISMMLFMVFGAMISTLFIELPDYWYDGAHYYVSYSSTMTNDIDTLLITAPKKNVKLGPIKVVATNQKIPDVGKHYYYVDKYLDYWHRIGFEKKETKTGETKSYHYLSWFRPLHKDAVEEEFEKKLSQIENDTIEVISIDISSYIPELIPLKKICKPAYAYQTRAIKFILSKYNSINNFNVVAMIYGPPGSGKTYTAPLLKRALETQFKGKRTSLYHDFDPTAIGVSMDKLILRHVTQVNPAIIVINEIDIFYEFALEKKEANDPRTQHAKNKNTFNNMLDSIANTKYVIAIYTTEQSPAELREIPQFRSFMRKGRIDFFINMRNKSVSFEAND
jgi:ATPase family associated with various cellular activities (AAA)